MANSFTARAKHIILSRSCRTPLDLEDAIRYLAYIEHNTLDQIVQRLKGFKCNFINTQHLPQLVALVIDKYKSCSTEEEVRDIDISVAERDYIGQVENWTVRRVLVSLLMEAKRSNHPSGWFHYNRDQHFDARCDKALSIVDKQAIIAQCVTLGLELRVIGSKHPTTCYRLSFMDNKPPFVLTVEPRDTAFVVEDTLFGESLL